MTATIIAIVIIIALYIWFRAYKRKKDYKIPTYYNTPTNYADLDHNQVVRKRSKKYVQNNPVTSETPYYDFIQGNQADIPNYTEPENTGFSGGFDGGEFSGGGAGESWSDNSNNSND